MGTTIPVITELDAARIRELAAFSRGANALPAVGDLLEWVKSETDVVPGDRIAPDVVTLGSTVSFREFDTRQVHRVSVVHPVEVSIPERRISVLSPVGRALLGRRVGEFTKVSMPGGGERRIEVLEMHYQPEAAGVLRP
jgi:regulator of nucleoside diphosphate kinase